MVKSLTVRDSLNMALDEELARDDKVQREKMFLLGLDLNRLFHILMILPEVGS